MKMKIINNTAIYGKHPPVMSLSVVSNTFETFYETHLICSRCHSVSFCWKKMQNQAECFYIKSFKLMYKHNVWCHSLFNVL